MKRPLLSLLLISSLVAISVSALSPTLEQECCAILGSEESYGDYLEEECAKLKLTEEQCEPISEGWRSAQDDFERSTRPEYACCVYLGRDDEALEIFDEEFVYETCPAFNLDPEKCAAIQYGFDYPDEEYNLSAGLGDNLDDDNKKIKDLIILAVIAFVAWLIWKHFKKSKKRK